ncbi:hypothetical protein [Pseudoalteromonas sp. MMG005]|uniref:hypothetical protein n=1 Tax=Pseudoalteromonas sp. MMG005 TaxID=2822682 RepID=UPI001B39FDD9|nr:hypothetical protein [Pseudoalteromonas sp. MMG005]MBQ4845048.1 hypothetical protein [Pseudoalteromonas sp. MMG005]
MDDDTKRDLEHLKSMVDYLRHLGLLSFAGLVLTSNLSIKMFTDPTWKIFAFLSVAGFFLGIVSSLLSQVGHIDRIRKDPIYELPLSNNFALPTALCLVGVLAGIMFMAAFVLLNWW